MSLLLKMSILPATHKWANKEAEAYTNSHLSSTLSSFPCSYTFFQMVPFHFKSPFVHFVVNIFSSLIGC